MSTIKEELQQVKAALPLMQRAWLYVKDRPGSVPGKVASALNETSGTVSSVLGLDYSRGMLTRVQVRDPKVKGHPYEYTVPSHMQEYVLLPMPKVKNENVRPNGLDIKPELAAPITRVSQVNQLIETLTIAEARTLYLQLHKMFGK
jgi:hypothetical protein